MRVDGQLASLRACGSSVDSYVMCKDRPRVLASVRIDGQLASLRACGSSVDPSVISQDRSRVLKNVCIEMGSLHP